MIPRFQNILVPVDFAEKNWAALDVAFEVAVHNKASVTVLHVIEEIDQGELDQDPEIERFYKRLEERAARELETMGQRFEEAAVEIREKIRFGKRAVEIVKYSNEYSTDLIVMSSHPIDPKSSNGIAVTLSYQVSLICACPILLVK